MRPSMPELDGFDHLKDEPVFDPRSDLSFEHPDSQVALADIGYSDEEIDSAPSPMAVALPFRILSDTGVEKLRSVTHQLEQQLAGVEGSRKLRANVFRSQYIADLCNSEELTAFLSQIAGVRLEACTFRLQQGHLNFAPSEVEREVVRWHYDTVNFSLAIMVSDPQEYDGADYEYFCGTVGEADQILRGQQALPVERVRKVPYRGAGYAMFAQGNRLEHRVTALSGPGERTTLVNCYLPAESDYPDPCTIDHMQAVDPHSLLYPEWVRHKALRSSRRLKLLADSIPHTDDYGRLATLLAEALSDAEQALRDLKRAESGAFSTKSSQYTYDQTKEGDRTKEG